jgi:hypothetical protein
MRTVYWVLGSLSLATVSFAQVQPSWWASRSVLSGQPDDYAAANIGQLKYVAAKAAEEFNAILAGGAGADIQGVITAWQSDAGAGVVRDDYAALNVGQLKTITALFYNRLAQYGYAGAPLAGGNRYPWTGYNPDDYAMVNLGQLKYVFSFLSPGYSFSSNRVDWDLDYLPDVWEIANGFGTNGNDASGNADFDELTNLAEYKAGTSPLFRDANALGLEIYTP